MSAVFPKDSDPNRTGRPIAGGLLAREPHLADAVQVERALGAICDRIAPLQTDIQARQQWQLVAQLSRTVADALARLCNSRPLRHNPKPTRVRLCALNKRDLDALNQAAEALMRTLDHGEDMVEPLHKLLRLEGRTVAEPLLRLLQIATPGVARGTGRAIQLRQQSLVSLGIELPLEAPHGPSAPTRAPASAGAPQRSAGRGRSWQCQGKVERVNRPRRCGTVRTKEGELVFFAAQAVPGGLFQLKVGDTVRLTVKQGPLGLTAIRVETATAMKVTSA